MSAYTPILHVIFAIYLYISFRATDEEPYETNSSSVANGTVDTGSAPLGTL